MNKLKQHNKNGFTIIEVLIVIAIIGILATILIVNYASWGTAAITVQLKSDLSNASSALENYRLTNKIYPADISSIFTPSQGNTITGGAIGTTGKYCVSVKNGSQNYFLSSKITKPEAGTCPWSYYEASPINNPYPAPQDPISDLSGNERNATLLNGVNYSNEVGGTYSFDGVDDRIETNANHTYGGNMTWSAWVKCSQSINSYNMFMGRHLPYFSFYNGSQLFFSTNIGGTQRVVSTAGNNLLNTWYYAVFTIEYDGTNTIMKIYRNGTLAATSPAYAGSQVNYSYKFTIGDGHPGSAWYPFKGMVSNVKIYDRTLSSSEIMENFKVDQKRYGL